MFRIDTPNAASTLPQPAPVGNQGYFQDSDPSGGTVVSADWLNHVQEEIAGFIESRGITLDKQDMAQLRKALDRTIATRETWDTLQVDAQHTVGVVGSTNVTLSGCAHTLVAASDGISVQNRGGQVIGGVGAVKWVLSSNAGYIGIRGIKFDPEYVAAHQVSNVTIPAGGYVAYNVQCKRVASELPLGGTTIMAFSGGSDEPYMLSAIAWITDVDANIYFTVVIRNHGTSAWSGGFSVYVVPVYEGNL